MEDPTLSFLLEVLKLSTAVVIGGWITSRVNRGTFQRQIKYDHERRRLDILVDLLGVTLPEIHEGLQSNWAGPNMTQEEKISALNDLKQAVDLAIPWFEGDKQIRKALNVLRTLIGVPPPTLEKAGLNAWVDFFESKKALREAVATMQQALYGNLEFDLPWYRRIFASPPE